MLCIFVCVSTLVLAHFKLGVSVSAKTKTPIPKFAFEISFCSSCPTENATTTTTTRFLYHPCVSGKRISNASIFDLEIHEIN